MKEQTRTVSTEQLEQYEAEARRMRSEELARLGGLLFAAPARLFKRDRLKALTGFHSTDVNAESAKA